MKEVTHPILKWRRALTVNEKMLNNIHFLEEVLDKERKELIQEMFKKGRAYVEGTLRQEFDIRTNSYITWARFVYVGRKAVHRIPKIKNPYLVMQG